jgi:hypothetical protein
MIVSPHSIYKTFMINVAKADSDNTHQSLATCPAFDISRYKDATGTASWLLK